jgi:prepilin-type N-terminal cleavage/methylation domain-containing protein
MLSSRRSGVRGFTMIEMLVVIAIIVLLAAILLPALHRVRAEGRKTVCKSQLGQIHKALAMYRDDFRSWREDSFPYRVTLLYSTGYLKGYKEIFLCQEDSSLGHQGGKPPAGAQQYAELDEHDKPGCLPLSYMYEFSGAQCTWAWQGYVGPKGAYFTQVIEVDSDANGIASWGEVKWAQLRYGDSWLHTNTKLDQYPPSKFPMLRCFWHTKDPDSDKDTKVINLAFSGNVFFSGARWETSTHE